LQPRDIRAEVLHSPSSPGGNWTYTGPQQYSYVAYKSNGGGGPGFYAPGTITFYSNAATPTPVATAQVQVFVGGAAHFGIGFAANNNVNWCAYIRHSG
jgi:hypothetical protein